MGATEDVKFGFKDRALAKQTLKALEKEEMPYRKATVRTLLGKANKVLVEYFNTVSKAEDKVKNLKEAIEVFESWLEEHDDGPSRSRDSKKQKDGDEKKTNSGEDKKKSKSDEDEKKSKSDEDDKELVIDEEKKETPDETVKKGKTGSSGRADGSSEKVEGLGFKDRGAAEATLKVLEGRDPSYQMLAVKGLLKSAARVLGNTKDETKVKNIKEGMAVLEQWERAGGAGGVNRDYLPLETARAAAKMLGDATGLHNRFLAASSAVGGEYKRLRGVNSEEKRDDAADKLMTWDIVRNQQLELLCNQVSDESELWRDGKPAPQLLRLASWAYAPPTLASRVRSALAAAPAPAPAPAPAARSLATKRAFTQNSNDAPPAKKA